MPLTAEQKSARDAFLRRPKPKAELVEYDGAQLEVRQPTLAVKGEIYRAAQLDVEADVDEADRPRKGPKGKVKARVTFDMVRLQILAVIACTYFPGTEAKVFNDVDFDTLADQLAGGGIDKLGEVAMRMINVKQADVEKKSEATPSSTSSTSSP